MDHKGLAYEEREPPGGYGSAGYRAIVPAGSVPGLVADGAPLFESNAILEFLEEIAPEPSILPRDAVARARVRGLLGFHDQRLEASVRALFPLVKRDWRAQPDLVEDAMRGVEAALERLAALEPWAAAGEGGPFASDLAYPCTLQMARMLGEEMERPPAVPAAVADWVARHAGTPAVARSLGVHRAAMETWMSGFRRPDAARIGGG
ncbi:MAG: glutathione S-transferase family protein [Paracoccaceae bacterium]